MSQLDSVDWHDLPVSELAITESGLSVTITPYIESSRTYGLQVFRITQAESISLQITGALSVSDLGANEVSSFSYAVAANGRLTGTIDFLPGQAGYWRISFSNAIWELANA